MHTLTYTFPLKIPNCSCSCSHVKVNIKNENSQHLYCGSHGVTCMDRTAHMTHMAHTLARWLADFLHSMVSGNVRWFAG